jgi:hypothetical protein
VAVSGSERPAGFFDIVKQSAKPCMCFRSDIHALCCVVLLCWLTAACSRFKHQESRCIVCADCCGFLTA